MALDLIPGFGAFTPAVAGGLDGSESDGTNLYTSGNDFTTPWFQNEGVTPTNNATIAPDGTTTAGLLVEDSGTNRHGNILNFSVITFSNGVDLTASFYAKKRERRYVYYAYEGSSDLVCVIYDLDTLTVADSDVGGTSAITSTNVQQGANGFVKCSVTFNAGTGRTNGYQFMGMSNAATNNNSTGAPPSYAGDGTSGAWFWRFKVTQ